MNKLSIRDKISLKFETPIECIKAVVANPKILLATTVISVAGQKINAQSLVGIPEVAGTPLIYDAGKTIDYKTFFMHDLNSPTTNFLSNQFEYAFGKDFKNKIADGTYNIGVSVGTNNLMINKKLVSDKLFEQINLVMRLSKLFKTPLNVKLGVSPTFGNYYFDGITFQGSTNTKFTGTGGIINLNKSGGIASYQGIQEVTFGGKHIAGLRIFNTATNKFLDAYYTIHGIADLSKKGEYVFTPYVSLSSNRTRIKKLDLDYNFAIFFKPLNTAKSKLLKSINGTFVYAEVGVNKHGQGTGFIRLNKLIPYQKEHKFKVVKIRDNLVSKHRQIDYTSKRAR